MAAGGGIKGGLKWAFKPFVNVHEWIGLRSIKFMTKGVANAVKVTFATDKPQQQETFEEAVTRLKLSPGAIEQRKQSFLRIALVMGILGVFCLFYMLYLLWSGYLGAGCFALVVAMIVFAYAYRFHFWYFQLKSKKLGCTFKEWLNAKASGEK